jgi:predicted phosphodiesterase
LGALPGSYLLLKILWDIMDLRLAVFSDIHGNWDALQSVLADMERNRIDSRFCLGDCLGYGPEPEQVVREIRTRKIPWVMGNHELGLVDPSYLDWFNKPTRTSLLITRRLLSEGSLTYFKGLSSILSDRDCRFVHGFPPDSITTYLYEVSNREIQRILTALPERICFIGHTHALHLIASEGQRITYLPFKPGVFSLREGVKYLVNVGSVGQPRDGNNQAKYVIWDSRTDDLELRYVTYTIAKIEEKTLGLDFPEYNARRLF